MKKGQNLAPGIKPEPIIDPPARLVLRRKTSGGDWDAAHHRTPVRGTPIPFDLRQTQEMPLLDLAGLVNHPLNDPNKE